MDAPQVPTPDQKYEYYSREKYSIETPGFSPDGPSTTHTNQYGSSAQEWQNNGQQWAPTQTHHEIPEGFVHTVDYGIPDGFTWGTYAAGDSGQESSAAEGTAANSAAQNYNTEVVPVSPAAAQIPYQYPYNEMGDFAGRSPTPLLYPKGSKPSCFAPYCGLQRRDFWILIAIATLLAIGAIVGGVVGAVTINKNSVASAALGANTPTEAPSPPPPGSDTTQSSLPVEERSIAASNVRNKLAKSNYQIVYQDLDTLDLVYQLVWDDKPASKQNMTVGITPDKGTPLAVVATNSNTTDNINLFVFFTTCEDRSNAPLLAAAQLNCIVGASNCTEVSHFPIPATSDLGKASKLAALAMNDGTSLRVFYQASNGHINVLRADTTANVEQWKSSPLDMSAMDGSKITASIQESSNDLLVVFVGAEDRVLQALQYDDISGTQEGMSKRQGLVTLQWTHFRA